MDEDDVRNDFQTAIQELSNNDGSTPPPPPPAPAPPSGDGTGAGAGEGEAGTKREDRDATGRFKPRTPAQDSLPADKKSGQEDPLKAGTPPAPTPAPAPGPTAIRPPVSWKPEEREGWEKMAPHHQKAILRREQEVNTALQKSVEARNFHSAVMEALQPYQGMLAAERATPLQAISTLFQTAAALRTAPPTNKAQMVAEMIFTHGINVDMLDAALRAKFSGQQMPNDPMYPIMQQLDQRFRPVTEFMQTFHQRHQMAMQQMEVEAEQTLEQFLTDPANEFAEDVREDMADLLDLAANRGQKLSLSDAYRRATMAHPTISQILERRAQEQAAAQRSAAAARARSAAVSVPGTGAPSQGNEEEEGDDVRSALKASIRQHSSRV